MTQIRHVGMKTRTSKFKMWRAGSKIVIMKGQKGSAQPGSFYCLEVQTKHNGCLRFRCYWKKNLVAYW